ncbi:S8 family serine peptidase [Ruixingdingia sedimenti]|uniref:S8 family serine peptidase n=1 Tax=Ruixingdingia sedimenti TaxID=3073604 RepID=A0ABU1F6H1_9RHOB|nr:S8 family serine peptidase [Xinfangfangia sp. LG-4]MDR5652198.1 S8 family serine peptidase [Xinfangfangia sp. LG-4]
MTVPSDPLYSQQWHFDLIATSRYSSARSRMETIWNEFTGVGVTVVVVDDGVQYNHPDLAGNYDASMHFQYGGVTYNPFPLAGDDGHGTACAGLIGSRQGNGQGGVGVAWDVTITGINMLEDTQHQSQAVFLASLAWAANFDIMSNSWGMTPVYDAGLNLAIAGSNARLQDAQFQYAVENGRGGLGTVIVHAAGNDTMNASGSGTNVSRYTLTISATESDGYATWYTNYGPSILIAAPASAVTTDRTGNDGYNNNTDGDPLPVNYTSTFNGTSAATPTVSGVVALMLDANEGLGWRDVANILAMSARNTGTDPGQPNWYGQYEVGEWGVGSTSNWNGGGNVYHMSYGYGMVDAYAAVRMAEVWTTLFGQAATSHNELSFTRNYNLAGVAINDYQVATLQANVTAAQAIQIESIYVTIELQHTWAADLQIALVAPDGLEIPLMYNEGSNFLFDSGFRWTFAVEALRGYSSQGTWQLAVYDTAAGDQGWLYDFDIQFFGSALTNNDVYHYTEDFWYLSSLDPSRLNVNDTDGGIDWLNFSAIAWDIQGSLGANGVFTNYGADLARLASTVQIENAVMGDGNDRVVGNGRANEIHGMRGRDILRGANGNDSLYGGQGNDLLHGGRHDDQLFGDEGRDRLLGSAGRDVLHGGAGANDVMIGGGGQDTFIFMQGDGRDRIMDFTDNIDTIRLDTDLWGGGRTVRQVVDTYSKVVGGNLVLDFGADKLVLVGVTDKAILYNDIDFF